LITYSPGKPVSNVKAISIQIVNYNNNQHAENENMQLKFFWEGIETIAAIMVMQHQ
jgi:hypothetical protein